MAHQVHAKAAWLGLHDDDVAIDDRDLAPVDLLLRTVRESVRIKEWLRRCRAACDALKVFAQGTADLLLIEALDGREKCLISDCWSHD